jgi:hypothetical protein
MNTAKGTSRAPATRVVTIRSPGIKREMATSQWLADRSRSDAVSTTPSMPIRLVTNRSRRMPSRRATEYPVVAPATTAT